MGLSPPPSIKRERAILGAHKAAETIDKPLQLREREITVLGAHKAAKTMGEESMTSTTTQINFDLEVPLGEVQPFRIAMNPRLFKSARSGDRRILDELLRPGEDAPTQEDTRCLLGVTLEGNTTLHIVASQGHLEIAKEICRREISLLAAPNTRLDTPLHCAARVGDDKMVSLIIQFAREGEIEKRRVLRARNMDEATALHEAAKYNHARVAKVLMDEDATLSSMLNDAGMSPLYLAIAIRSLNVAKVLLQSSSWKNASPESYAGPNKNTALHAAVLLSPGNRALDLHTDLAPFFFLFLKKSTHDTFHDAYVIEITQDLLDWKPELAKGVGFLGTIPLHYAASDGRHDTVKLLLERDPSTAYQLNANGSFPIHIASRMGNVSTVDEILKQCPDTDELLDGRGRNFLHVAFKWRRLDVVKKIISKRPELRKLLNDQDNKGNTPLHTAVKNSDKASVYFLLRDKTVCVNVINHDGFTPLDLAFKLSDRGLQFRTVKLLTTSCMFCLPYITSCSLSRARTHGHEGTERLCLEHKHNAKVCICQLLGFNKGSVRSSDDKFKKESSNVEESPIERQLNFTRNLGIATVLIATVTFAAGFTVPGDYIADDHPGRGTAVLAKEYAFKVFLVSDASALVCSIVATFWIMCHAPASARHVRHLV
ncbi:ankyrin-1-like, partial [Phoenix dactylifera]|uniref:Ankyrin-1-like n=1 Tax=Phoenix dactylifera TaxID=42345 RepID=A0A8B8ZY41_PHODC